MDLSITRTNGDEMDFFSYRGGRLFAEGVDVNGIVDLCAIHVHLGSGGRTIFILDMFNSVG
jgi:hypothetical protein